MLNTSISELSRISITLAFLIPVAVIPINLNVPDPKWFNSPYYQLYHTAVIHGLTLIGMASGVVMYYIRNKKMWQSSVKYMIPFWS